MEHKASNGGAAAPAVLAGLRLILEEIRDLRRDMAEDRKKSAGEMRRFAEEAAEDRRTAAEDRRTAAEDRRQFTRALLKVGRDIISTQRHHTDRLQKILQTLKTRLNGGNGNGRQGRGAR